MSKDNKNIEQRKYLIPQHIVTQVSSAISSTQQEDEIMFTEHFLRATILKKLTSTFK